jgi:hypothetical protein
MQKSEARNGTNPFLSHPSALEALRTAITSQLLHRSLRDSNNPAGQLERHKHLDMREDTTAIVSLDLHIVLDICPDKEKNY